MVCPGQPRRGAKGSIERRCEAPAVLARQRMFDSELVENPDDHAPNVVAAAVAGRNRVDEQLQAALDVIRVQRAEGLGVAVLVLESDAGRERVGLEGLA